MNDKDKKTDWDTVLENQNWIPYLLGVILSNGQQRILTPGGKIIQDELKSLVIDAAGEPPAAEASFLVNLFPDQETARRYYVKNFLEELSLGKPTRKDLWGFFNAEHNLLLLDSEMQDIIDAVLEYAYQAGDNFKYHIIKRSDGTS